MELQEVYKNVYEISNGVINRINSPSCFYALNGDIMVKMVDKNTNPWAVCYYNLIEINVKKIKKYLIKNKEKYRKNVKWELRKLLVHELTHYYQFMNNEIQQCVSHRNMFLYLTQRHEMEAVCQEAIFVFNKTNRSDYFCLSIALDPYKKHLKNNEYKIIFNMYLKFYKDNKYIKKYLF